MTKTEVSKEMSRFLGGAGFISKSEIAQFLGYKDYHVASQYVADLKRVNGKYFIGDVAANIVSAGVYGD